MRLDTTRMQILTKRMQTLELKSGLWSHVDRLRQAKPVKCSERFLHLHEVDCLILGTFLKKATIVHSILLYKR